MHSICVNILVSAVLLSAAVVVVVAVLPAKAKQCSRSDSDAAAAEVGCMKDSSNSTTTTYRMCNKTPEIYKLPWNYDPKDKVGKGLRLYWKNNLTQILQSTQFPPRTVESHNGFVLSVLEAYNGHHNLILRPDDVWAAIMVQFSFYVNRHAEELRSKFVSFSGKRELEVAVAGSLHSAPYDQLVTLMTQQIDKNLVDPQVKAWILPSFSTTTENDRVTVGVVFMGSMKKYFDYKFSLTCGIPWITLEGNLADWKDIYRRVDKLKEYGLERWAAMLKPVLSQFVAAKEGHFVVDFWQKICHHMSGGSGPSVLSGWITTFSVFDEQGEWLNSTRVYTSPNDAPEDIPIDTWLRLDVSNVPSGLVEVDVTISDNGVNHKGVLLGGHMAMQAMEDKRTLRPSPGWLIGLKQKD